jgi:hypothetical protein
MAPAIQIRVNPELDTDTLKREAERLRSHMTNWRPKGKMQVFHHTLPVVGSSDLSFRKSKRALVVAPIL